MLFSRKLLRNLYPVVFLHRSEYLSVFELPAKLKYMLPCVTRWRWYLLSRWQSTTTWIRASCVTVFLNYINMLYIYTYIVVSLSCNHAIAVVRSSNSFELIRRWERRALRAGCESNCFVNECHVTCSFTVISAASRCGFSKTFGYQMIRAWELWHRSICRDRVSLRHKSISELRCRRNCEEGRINNNSHQRLRKFHCDLRDLIFFNFFPENVSLMFFSERETSKRYVSRIYFYASISMHAIL